MEKKKVLQDSTRVLVDSMAFERFPLATLRRDEIVSRASIRMGNCDDKRKPSRPYRTRKEGYEGENKEKKGERYYAYGARSAYVTYSRPFHITRP